MNMLTFGAQYCTMNVAGNGQSVSTDKKGVPTNCDIQVQGNVP